MSKKDFFIEIDHASIEKCGQMVCGDVFMSRKVQKEGRTVCVLSDGLGSGIKANVLATMTASMALNFTLADQPIERSARSIRNTLPQDEVRKISYASFTIIDNSYDGATRIIEYGNPQCLVFRNTTPLPLENNLTDSPDQLAVNAIQVGKGDRIVLFSDGVSQSGMGRNDMPFGWEMDAVSDFISWQIGRNNEISAHDLCKKIVVQANNNDRYHARDDITCSVIYFREPRAMLVCSGPPYNIDKDGYVAKVMDEFDGAKVICGGTTAQIMSRELKRDIEMDLFSGVDGIPPVSYMDGVDLVTEGILTLGKISATLANHSFDQLQKRNPARKLMEMFMAHDKITFLVGTKVNEAHQDPNLPAELDIRRNVIKKIAAILQNEYLKAVDIKYI